MNVVAHAGGAGWDEVLVLILPFVVAAVIATIAQGRLGKTPR